MESAEITDDRKTGRTISRPNSVSPAIRVCKRIPVDPRDIGISGFAGLTDKQSLSVQGQ